MKVYLYLRESEIQTLFAHLNDRPANLAKRFNIPECLDKIIIKTLEKDPKDRFQSIEEFGEALEAIKV